MNEFARVTPTAPDTSRLVAQVRTDHDQAKLVRIAHAECGMVLDDDELALLDRVTEGTAIAIAAEMPPGWENVGEEATPEAEEDGLSDQEIDDIVEDLERFQVLCDRAFEALEQSGFVFLASKFDEKVYDLRGLASDEAEAFVNSHTTVEADALAARTDPAILDRVLNALLPEHAEQQSVLRFLGETIRDFQARLGTSWVLSILPHDFSIRLTVGNYYAVIVTPGDLTVTVFDAEGFAGRPEAEKTMWWTREVKSATIAKATGANPEYITVVLSDLAALAPALHAEQASFLTFEAGRKVPGNTARAHAPVLVERIRRETGLSIDEPEWMTAHK